MSDATVHRGADASGTWVSEPDARGCGALLGHALHPRPLARRCPAHGGPSDRGSGCPKRRDLYNFCDLRRRVSGKARASTDL
jgi:asparagine synthase (glutamine-hydrolysing)